MRKCLKPECSGRLEITSLKNCSGYFVAYEEKCTICEKTYASSEKKIKKFENEIVLFDEFKKLKYSLYSQRDNQENGAKWDNVIEITTQHILATKILPHYQVILMDSGGEKSSQYDLLARKEKHSIAIEITQAANKTDIESTLQLENINYRINSSLLKFEWCIGFNSGCNPAKKKIKEKIIKLLAKLEIIAKGKNELEIDCSDPKYCTTHEYNQLFSMGIHYFHASQVGSAPGEIYCVGPTESWQDGEIGCIFKVVSLHANKGDNIKKLSLAQTSERHLFIPITKFQAEAASYVDKMTDKVEVFNDEELAAQLGINRLLPDGIDVVWIGTFFNFDKDKNIGYKIAKIYKDRAKIFFTPITQGVAPYE